ncbi:MAG: FAD-dependent thymidylate synthase [Clostridiales bacterium]|nr:FAD-dependent thymidylate synthase [Clostridiales bacterium]
MPERSLRVQLVRHTDASQALVALGARLCYAGGNVDSLVEQVSLKDQQAFVEKVMGMGHESVLEHASFSFLVEGVSRVLLAQLTRHRIASFSVQSQRYVSYQSGFGYIVPPSIRELGEDAVAEYEAQMAQMQSWYEMWQERLGNAGEKSNEDARFVLPGACETRILFTMNARELRHFFSLRMCNRAQWEIRAMAQSMYEQVYPIAPALFADAGPGCISGVCPEGGRSCGRMLEMRSQRKAFLERMKQADAQPDQD